MARKAVTAGRCNIRLACQVFSISETCYRYRAKRRHENVEIADWLVRLTHNQRNWGFGLCYLYLRNVKGFRWNHKRVYRVYRSLELNLRIKPQAIRCDNGPEYVSHKLVAWARRQGIALRYIQPDKPQQNAYVERYNRIIRYDWLSHYLFESIAEVQDFATRWLWTYNNERPNMALGDITPKQKVAMAA